MKMLSSEVKTLLDKLYNLRGEDSVILTKMNKEREEAIETGERTKNEKAVLLEKIAKLSEEEKTLQEEGDKLSSILSSINRDDFANVLDRLKIDFDPSTINVKITSMLPDTIKKVVEENQKASEELESVEAQMNNAITKVEELGIRKDEALSNQEKLNEYFRLALDGNINITRDEITNLLEKFNFNEDEQREAAKILMFPEDALYEYDASTKSSDSKSGKTITEVLVEAKKESTPVNEEIKEEQTLPEEEQTLLKESVNADNSLENIFAKAIEEEHIEDEIKEEQPQENELTKLNELLTKNNINDLNIESLEKILANYDEELIIKNIETLNNKNINLEVLKDNVQILYDKELEQKLNKLLEIGKESRDISLMPEVLVKYDLQGLNNTINVLEISGLDPKKVPLLAY